MASHIVVSPSIFNKGSSTIQNEAALIMVCSQTRHVEEEKETEEKKVEKIVVSLISVYTASDVSSYFVSVFRYRNTQWSQSDI